MINNTPAPPAGNNATPPSLIERVRKVTFDYLGKVSGAKDLVFKPIKFAIDLAHFNGKQSRITENVQKLAEDAGSVLDFTEIVPKIYKAVSCLFSFTFSWFNFGELIAKISQAAATVFKCAEFLAKKGVAMWDASVLKLWANRFNTIGFGWGMFEELDKLYKNPVSNDREFHDRNYSLIKLAFNTSLFTLVAFGSMLSPVGILACSGTALATSIGREFYGQLNGLVAAG